MAKILGMPPRTAAIVIGGSAVAAGAWLWWRKRNAAASTTSSSASSTGCTDSSGNSVPCPDGSSTDVQGELSVIQTELESLLASEGTGTTATGTTTTTDKGVPGSPSGLKVSGITQSGFKAAWTAPAATAKGAVAEGYTWDVTQGGKFVKSGKVAGTSVTVSGLKRNTAYEFLVRACAHPGCSPNVTANVKTRA